MPGFFFTQSFLTGVKQGFARKVKCSIDKVDFRFQVLKEYDPAKLPKIGEGCYAHGLYMEGGGWDIEK